jgi:hypothetical protein
MFARKVSVCLKSGKLHEFANLMQSEILVWLRQQEGFLDLITLVAPNGCEVATITFWDHEVSAQCWNVSGYPEALKTLEGLLDGLPYVKTFEVVGSTLHRLTLTNGDAASRVRQTERELYLRTFETNA